MANSLNGKTVLVTGGGTGLGYGTAKQLSAAGAFIYIVGRRKDVLERAAAELGENVKAVPADVSSKADMDRVASVIKEERGHLDAVFANAGLCVEKALDDITEDFVDKIINVNIKGTLFTVQAMVPIMPEGSSIILTSSMTAMIGLRRYTVYAATKAAIRAMARCWVTDLKARKIRVNSISPGCVPTEGSVRGLTDEQIKDFLALCAKETPCGRVGTVEDIGNAVVFLASDESSFINGVDICVDDGQTQIYAGALQAS